MNISALLTTIMHSNNNIDIVIIMTYDSFYYNSGCYNINIMDNNNGVSTNVIQYNF